MTIPYINESKIFKLNPIQSPIKGIAYALFGLAIGVMAYQNSDSDSDWLLTIVHLIWFGLSFHFVIKGIFLISNKNKQIILLKQEFLHYVPLADQEDEDLKDFELEEIALESLNLKQCTAFFLQSLNSSSKTEPYHLEQIILRIGDKEHIFQGLEFTSLHDWTEFKTLLERKISYTLWAQSPILLTELKEESQRSKQYISTKKSLHIQLSILLLLVLTILDKYGLIKLENADMEHLSYFNIIQNHLIIHQFGALFAPLMDFKNQFISSNLTLISSSLINISIIQISFHIFVFSKLLPPLEYQIGRYKTLIIMIISAYLAYLSSFFVFTEAFSFGPGPMWAAALGVLYYRKNFDPQYMAMVPRNIQQELQQSIKNIGIILFVFSLQVDSIPFLPFDFTKYVVAFFAGILCFQLIKKLKDHQSKFLAIALSALTLFSFLYFSFQHEFNPPSAEKNNALINQRFAVQYKNHVELQMIAHECLKQNCPTDTLKIIIPQLETLGGYYPNDQDFLETLSALYAIYAQNIPSHAHTHISPEWQKAYAYAWRALDTHYKKEINPKQNKIEEAISSHSAQLIQYLLHLPKFKENHTIPQINGQCEYLKQNLSFDFNPEKAHFTIDFKAFTPQEIATFQEIFFAPQKEMRFQFSMTLENQKNQITDLIDIELLHLNQDQTFTFPLKPKSYENLNQIKHQQQRCQLSFFEQGYLKSKTRARQYFIK